MDYTWIFVVLFGVAAILGLRGSLRLTRRYYAVARELHHNERLLLFGIVLVAWGGTITALYAGGLTVRRMLGYQPLPELVPVTALLFTAMLYVPAFLDYVVERVVGSSDG